MPPSIEMRPSTPTDFAQYYGGPPGRTVRAVTILLNGNIVCVAGVEYLDGIYVAFSNSNASIPVSDIVKYRYIKKIVQWIKGLNLPVIVPENIDRQNSDRFLRSVGFQQFSKYDNIRLYRL